MASLCYIGVAFSPNGEYFAYSSPDGCLKIWETSSNVLKQEYTPSSHLSSTCSSLSWGPCKHNANPPQRRAKKSRTDVLTTVADLNLIAMGTLSGEVLLYSVTKGDLHTKLTGGHSGTVNGIWWQASDDSLFTCSSDQYIVRWSISKGTVLGKWNTGKTPLHAICAISSDSILSANNSIMWYDLKKKRVIKKFSGHASEVFQLIPINMSESAVETQYFISSAIGDRFISAWQLKEDSDCNTVATFTLSDEASNVDISKSSTKSKPLIISVVTKSGHLHIFEHQLNGKVKTPLQPKVTIHIASPATESKPKSQPVPILAAKLSENLDSCIVAYGNFLRPTFEKMEFQDFESVTYLIRKGYLPTEVSVEEGICKIKEPDKPNDVKLLAPGYMTPSKPTENFLRKRKQKESTSKDLPMEERLNAMYLGQAPEGHEVEGSAAKSDSVIHLLLQGLQSKDNNLLNTVLQCGDEVLIKNTVKRLPVASIPLLLKELHRRLTKQEPRNHPCLRWIKGLLSAHWPYLVSCKEVDEYLGPLTQLLEARIDTFSKMSQINGCLIILSSQIASGKEESNVDVSADPLLVYEEVSSEEENADDDDEMDHLESSSIAENNLPMTSESSSEDDECEPSDNEMENL